MHGDKIIRIPVRVPIRKGRFALLDLAITFHKSARAELNMFARGGVVVGSAHFDVQDRIAKIIGRLEDLRVPDVFTNAVIETEELDMRPLCDGAGSTAKIA